MDSKDIKKLSEEELEAIYIYLDINLDSMTEEEKQMWNEVLEKFDSENYED